MPKTSIPFDPVRGERIEQLRVAAGFPTQKSLAEAVGVAARSVWSWEHGGGMKETALRVLAAELHKSVRFILTGEDDAAAEIELAGPQLITDLRLGHRFSDVEERLAGVESALRDLTAAVTLLIQADEEPPAEPGDSQQQRPAKRNGGSTTSTPNPPANG